VRSGNPPEFRLARHPERRRRDLRVFIFVVVPFVLGAVGYLAAPAPPYRYRPCILGVRGPVCAYVPASGLVDRGLTWFVVGVAIGLLIDFVLFRWSRRHSRAMPPEEVARRLSSDSDSAGAAPR